MKKILEFLNQIKEFFLCMLRGKCEYSIKKFLVYVFSILVIYVVIFTDKEYLELLFFIAALLGLRSYDKLKYNEQENKG